MKRYALSFIILVIAIGAPFLLINPGEKSVMRGGERVSQRMLSDTLIDAIRIAEKNYYKPIEDSNEMFRGLNQRRTCVS